MILSLENALEKICNEMGQTASENRLKYQQKQKQQQQQKQKQQQQQQTLSFGNSEEGKINATNLEIQTMPAETLDFDFMDGENNDTNNTNNKENDHNHFDYDDNGYSSGSSDSGSAFEDKEGEEESDSDNQQVPQSRPLKRKLTNEDGMLLTSENKKARKISKGKSWKRSDQTQRLMRLATNGEDLRGLVTRWIQQQKENPKFRKIARIRTMEETIEEGCKWLMSLLDRELQVQNL